MLDSISVYSLKCFAKVAELKNITSAADSLYLTQPTLSRKLAKLEAELGKELIRRTKKGIELTPDGLVFYEQCKQIISALDGLEDPQAVVKNITGMLKIGYQRPTLDFVIDFNSRFAGAFPDVNLVSVRLGKQNVVNELLYGDLDMSIIYEHELKNFSKVINWIPIGSCKMAIMLSHRHPLANRKVIHIRELKDDKFIMLDRNIAPVKIDELYTHCNDNGFVPNVVRVEKEHLDIVADVVTLNAVSFTPISRKGHSGDMPVDEAIQYVELEGFDTDYPVSLAWPVGNVNPLVPIYTSVVRTILANPEQDGIG